MVKYYELSDGDRQTISITIALAPPPPLQIAAAPIFPLFCFNTFINVTIIRAPLQPNG
jgi:ABC-type microcin C transport system duplicated ATPase subunit YejF